MSAAPIKVLVIDDEPPIRKLLRVGLSAQGYAVNEAQNAAAARLSVEEDQPDLIVLDLGLPRLDGLEVCRRLRTEGQSVPVLILTARADEVDTVIGLDAGADDYVTKPFRLAEFLARVRALLRRGSTETSMAQGVRVDTEARRAWLGDTELDLTTKEFDLLSVLVNEAGKVVTVVRLGAHGQGAGIGRGGGPAAGRARGQQGQADDGQGTAHVRDCDTARHRSVGPTLTG